MGTFQNVWNFWKHLETSWNRLEPFGNFLKPSRNVEKLLGNFWKRLETTPGFRYPAESVLIGSHGQKCCAAQRWCRQHDPSGIRVNTWGQTKCYESLTGARNMKGSERWALSLGKRHSPPPKVWETLFAIRFFGGVSRRKY